MEFDAAVKHGCTLKAVCMSSVLRGHVPAAQDTTKRGTYAFSKRWPGPVAEGGSRNDADPDGVLWRKLDPERSVLRYGFASPSYVIGSTGLDPRWLDDTSMGFRWQGVVFAGDPWARIGFEVKPASRKDWHGFNPFFSVQDRNILITQKWPGRCLRSGRPTRGSAKRPRVFDDSATNTPFLVPMLRTTRSGMFQPPDTAGMMVTTSPGASCVSIPSRSRM